MGRPEYDARPLRLAPFRALRYNPSLVADLGAVTCPPYDVISGDRIGTWEAADPHNVVRLILPRGNGEDQYGHAAQHLRTWLTEQVLIRDDRPALYVYQHSSADEGEALGLIGAASLHDPAEGRIVPHEDVFPGPVADRAALMRATDGQFEPILLTYEGNGATSDTVDAVVESPPMLEVRTADGATHRLWRITDPEFHTTVSADLADRQVLIADGHHRYAAYLALCHDAADSADDPRMYGLGMLVDAARHPLTLGAIHRSVAEIALQDAIDAARPAFHSVETRDTTGGADTIASIAGDHASGSRNRFVISDGRTVALLSDPRSDAVRSSMPADRSELWQSLDSSIANRLIFGALWKVEDNDSRVAYHHRAADALERAEQTSGIALLLAPARHSDVLALAARGERMPRKSTSFGPKPRTGLLMRLLDE